jgi:hypothetical protein
VPGFKSSNAFAKLLLNGWQVSNITILQKGSPFSVTCGSGFAAIKDGLGNVIGNSGCDYNADGVNNDRPSVASGVPVDGFSKSQFLTTGIFTANEFSSPAFGQNGNMGRNFFTGPGYINTDFSATKKTRIPWFVGNEGAQLEFRAEFFNVFNNVNLTGVSSDITAGNFGLATGVFPARDIQLGLRLEF